MVEGDATPDARHAAEQQQLRKGVRNVARAPVTRLSSPGPATLTRGRQSRANLITESFPSRATVAAADEFAHELARFYHVVVGYVGLRQSALCTLDLDATALSVQRVSDARIDLVDVGRWISSGPPLPRLFARRSRGTRERLFNARFTGNQPDFLLIDPDANLADELANDSAAARRIGLMDRVVQPTHQAEAMRGTRCVVLARGELSTYSCNRVNSASALAA